MNTRSGVVPRSFHVQQVSGVNLNFCVGILDGMCTARAILPRSLRDLIISTVPLMVMAPPSVQPDGSYSIHGVHSHSRPSIIAADCDSTTANRCWRSENVESSVDVHSKRLGLSSYGHHVDPVICTCISFLCVARNFLHVTSKVFFGEQSYE